MPIKKYNTPHAFLMAINDRLKTISEKEKIPIVRLRRHLAFDRLLTRLFKVSKCPWVLKGGYAMGITNKACSGYKRY